MPLIPEVMMVEVRRFDAAGGAFLLVHALGNVPTSGWSGLRLAPTYYAAPPADRLWEFEFHADPPHDLVLEVVLPVSAEGLFAAPEWARGVRVHAGNNSLAATEFEPATPVRSLAHRFDPAARPAAVLVRQDLASFDDGASPIGFGADFGRIRMKNLRHRLTLTIAGPDEAEIRRCLAETAGRGRVAAIVAAYATGGGAISATVSALLLQLQDDLGPAFDIRVDDRADWIEWRT